MGMVKKSSLTGKDAGSLAGAAVRKKMIQAPRRGPDVKQQLVQRNAELQVINAVQTALAAESDIHGIYNAVGDKLGEIFSTQTLAIYSVDLNAQTIRLEYDIEKGQKVPPTDLPFNSLYKHVFSLNKTFVINRNFPQFAAKFKDYQVIGNVTPISVLITPVIRKKASNQVVSICLFDMDNSKVFADTDVRLVETVARTMRLALENARLFAETRQRIAELAVINSVQQGLASKLEMQEIYNLVGDKIREIFATDTTFIAYRDEERNLLLTAYYADGKLQRSFNRPYGTGIAEAIIESGRPLLLRSALEHQKYGAHHVSSPGTKKDLNQSVLGVPIFKNDRPYGAVSIQSYTANAFDENDLRLLQTMTNSMNVALENARLFDETQQRNAELAIINSVQAGLASKLDVQAIYELVGDKIRTTFNAQVVSIDTYDRDVRILRGRYYFEADRVQAGATYPCFGFRKHVIENRQSIIINRDMQHWIKEYENPVIQGVQPKSAIFIPMIVGRDAMGVISLQNNDQENAFTEADVRLLTTLANSMSIALENARLWEQEKLYRKALQRELEIGRDIQAGFLPATLPIIEGWEIAASLMSAREVAGDFYDTFELPDGNIGLVIADVCDKGVGAALFMTLFRSLIRAAANLDFFEHPGEANKTLSAADRLQRSILLTNNYIAETHGDSGMFATIFFGILNPQDGKLTYINGGHEPPLIVRSGAVGEVLQKTGPAVGAITDCRFNLRETQLNRGDMFFAFTDGVPDCRNLADEEFGRDRLMTVLQIVNKSAHKVIEAAEAELRNYIGGATQFDDITLLAVRRC
jgi:serine phosphatase RsbU (regulator of sigma subunit)